MMAKFRLNKQYRKSFNQKLLMLPIVLALFAVVALAGISLWYMSNLRPFSSSLNEVTIIVPSGMTAPQISKLLQDKRIIRSSRAFDWYTKLHNKRTLLRAGGYKFKPSYRVTDIVDMLVNGDISADLVTIFPERTLAEIKFDFKKVGYTDTAIKTAFNPSLYKSQPVLADKPFGVSLEGYLFPETFQKTAQTSLETTLRASLKQMYKAVLPNIPAYKQEGLNIHQAITLASIVEKEVGSSKDRRQVAQVFLKRLREGVRLGSDITAFYGADIAGLDRSVFTDTPYNTRLHNGLPPGPVSNVSKVSLDAVANPASGDFLYFVTGDNKVTYFSRTLREHQINIEKYCVENCK